jgi:hypothetical protein
MTRTLALNLAHMIDATTPYRPGERPLLSPRQRFGVAWVPMLIGAVGLIALAMN